MKIRLGTLKKLIREIALEDRKGKRGAAWGGSSPEEAYNAELLDDPHYKEKSVYVPDDIKDKINAWAKDMGLKTK
jgi:hypothetical protein